MSLASSQLSKKDFFFAKKRRAKPAHLTSSAPIHLHVAILLTQRKGIIICFEAGMFWTLECKIFTHISLVCLSQIKGNTNTTQYIEDSQGSSHL
jgi:hypothetical protein